MNRSTNEGIRRGSLNVVFVLAGFLAVVVILSLFSRGSTGSLKDEVSRMTVTNTERHLLAVTNKVPKTTGRVVRDEVVNTNNQGFEVKTKVGEIRFK
jgi:hypothetical protein